jgi:hypothetical protein
MKKALLLLAMVAVTGSVHAVLPADLRQLARSRRFRSPKGRIRRAGAWRSSSRCTGRHACARRPILRTTSDTPASGTGCLTSRRSPWNSAAGSLMSSSRHFHDEVLGGGQLPLDLLEKRIRTGSRSRATTMSAADSEPPPATPRRPRPTCSEDDRPASPGSTLNAAPRQAGRSVLASF